MLALLAVLTGPVLAQAPQRSFDPALADSDAMLEAHPDRRYQRIGTRAYAERRWEDAANAYRLAARHGDKPSQAVIAEMLWKGLGMSQDRPLAHAWMSVAAERGYSMFVTKRDLFWQQLDAAERERAEALLPTVLAEYGDAVAKPRQEVAMRRQLRTRTGTRLASTAVTSPMTIQVRMADGEMAQLPAEQFYAPQYFEPQQYWAMQDQQFERLTRIMIRIGEIEQVKPAAPAPEQPRN